MWKRDPIPQNVPKNVLLKSNAARGSSKPSRVAPGPPGNTLSRPGASVTVRAYAEAWNVTPGACTALYALQNSTRSRHSLSIRLRKIACSRRFCTGSVAPMLCQRRPPSSLRVCLLLPTSSLSACICEPRPLTELGRPVQETHRKCPGLCSFSALHTRRYVKQKDTTLRVFHTNVWSPARSRVFRSLPLVPLVQACTRASRCTLDLECGLEGYHGKSEPRYHLCQCLRFIPSLQANAASLPLVQALSHAVSEARPGPLRTLTHVPYSLPYWQFRVHKSK